MEALLLLPVINPDANKLEEAYEVARDHWAAYKGSRIRVPAAFQYDGASIPRLVWPVIGSPFQPRFMNAAVFHDWIYHTHQIERCEADNLFHELLLESGVAAETAATMRYAVRSFGGWYWENDEDDCAYIRRLTDRIIADGRTPAIYGLCA
ncbi:MAG: DUF1353 domain-containing protein [Desulfobacterales bacterium]|jgi:hypothetical protein|nr:DUF1353 domain-containing protein [Desulfobacterales bacterium]